MKFIFETHDLGIIIAFPGGSKLDQVKMARCMETLIRMEAERSDFIERGVWLECVQNRDRQAASG